MTAAHVVTDWLDRFGAEGERQNIEIWAIHIEPGPKYAVWVVDRAWISPISDLAILHTRALNDIAIADQDVASVALDLDPPQIGARIVGFGNYQPTQQVILGENLCRHIELNGPGAASVGEVKAVHPERRDTARLRFPCFQVNARFDGGMSGGPIFSDNGNLCGVICSNLPPTNPNEEHVSYATTLWPLMGIEIDIDAGGNPSEEPYPVLELARQGIVRARGHERVRVRRESNIVSISLEPPRK